MGCAHPPTSAIDQTPGLLWLLIPVNVGQTGLAGLGPKIQATIKDQTLQLRRLPRGCGVLVGGRVKPGHDPKQIPTSPYLTP